MVKIKTLIARFHKIRKQREKAFRLADIAAKREKEKRRREERAFRILKNNSAKTRQLVNVYGSRISSLEKKLDRIMRKNKLKS